MSTDIINGVSRTAAVESTGSRWWWAFTAALLADYQASKRDWRVAVVLGLGMLMAIIAAFTRALGTQATIAERAAAQAASGKIGKSLL